MTNKLLLVLLVILQYACASVEVEKPVPASISSPENLLNTGIEQYNNNNYQKAIQLFERALLQYRSIDNQTGIAKSTLNLAKSLMAINNNKPAAQYLLKAEAVIKQASLNELNEHLYLLESTLAIKQGLYISALQKLEPLLSSNNANIKLAALKNRTKISFLENAEDRQQWLSKYKNELKRSTEKKPSHQAIIYRFKAELTEPAKTKLELLQQSLAISRKLADRPAIAATLTQSAAVDMTTENFRDAEDKYLRALFIRHQLGDVKNSQIILQQLQTIYTVTGNARKNLTAYWLNRIENNKLADWEQLYNDFETYPVIQ